MDCLKYNGKTPGSPSEWFDLGVFYRRNACFGEAVNAFMTAAETTADENLRARALASIELIRDINGFVNTDLMNP